MSIQELYRATGVATEKVEQRKASQPARPQGPSEFEKLLGQVRFSQHAENRIRSRMIPWDADLERRVCEGIQTAESKGSREALILTDKVAVIANVKSRTVVTAMDRAQLKERIFTNIDSAVLV